jgi:eukaryotic-like serine/threonine-protein kinase
MGISPDEWERVKVLLEEALRLRSEEVPAFLDRAAASGDVRRELERLLTYRDEAAAFLSSPVLPQVDEPGVSYRLNSGRILCRRFRIVRFVAAGGMGEIYEARDQELQETIAIKTIRRDLSSQAAFLQRFRREVHLAKQVTHPNVCRIYDLFRHSDSDDDCVFVSMEFLSGETLAERLKRTGRMTITEALPIILQMTEALGAAHAAGILHRDFKPGNVILVSPSDGVNVRAVVTDFGLAFCPTEDTASRSTHIIGTPAYMSPEQIEGRPLTEASDIYALGLVMYEVVTGKSPFDASSLTPTIMKRLYSSPAPPRTYYPDLDRTLDKTILRCLEPVPRNRIQTAREVIQAVRSIHLNGASGNTSAHDWHSWGRATLSLHSKTKSALVLASLIVLIIVGLFSYSHLRSRPPQEVATKSIVRRRTVAVLNFKNSTSRPDADWLSTALPEMFTTELAAGEQLRTIPGEQVAQMKMNLALPDSDTLGAQTLSRVGKTLGADFVVLGSYVALTGGNLRIDLHLQDVAAGDTLLSVKETGDEDNLFDLVSRAGSQLREKCGVGQVNAGDQAGVRAALPSSTEGSKFYAEGLAKLRVGDAIAARELLEEAVAAEPAHALAHSALASAWTLLGYDEKARLSAKSAFELSGSLSREDRLLTEARYHEASKEWDKAAENYRALFGFFDDNLEYGLLLAEAQTSGGKGKEGLTTIESLRKLPPPAGDDSRIDLAASEAWRSMGDFKKSEAFAAQAAQKARTQNAKQLLARALYLQGSTLENLGDASGALAAVEEAGRIYQAISDHYGFASTLEVMGQVLVDRGDYPAALAKFNDELAIAREIRNRKAESSALSDIAGVLVQQGNAAKARTMYDRALSVFREVSDKGNSAMTLISIAGIMQDEGDLSGAKKTYDQALSLFREINNQNGIALSLTGISTALDGQGDSAAAKKMLEQAIALDLANGQTNPSTDKLIGLGDALQHLGDLTGARKNYQDALTLARAAGDKSITAYGLVGLGSLELKAADFAQAHKDYEEALALRDELGEKDNVAGTQVAIAELDIEEGHPGAAEGPARKARDEFQRAHKSDDQIAATATLVDALLADGKDDEASKELGKVAAMSAKSQNLSVQLTFAATRARAKAAAREYGAAETIVREALAKATKSGYLGYEFECRLALEELAVKFGRSPASRAGLEQLQKESKAKGFDLIAHKASAI